MPNPIRFCYTENESLLNKLSFSIKYVLTYIYKDSLATKRLTSRVALWWYQGRLILVLGSHVVSRDFFIYYSNVTSKMASGRS